MKSGGLDLIEELPEPPNPNEEDFSNYKGRSDWAGLFFEWHKTVGMLALTFSFMLPASPAIKRIRKINYLILTALLNRCARLAMANLRMASENRHAEAMAIIDRSLQETALKLMWLCETKSKERFQRYLADGLRNDIEFRSYIEKKIENRGHQLEIERRMLGSIRRSMLTSGILEKEISKIKRLPDLASMMQEIGWRDLGYIVVQRMGSHSVHGTWTALLAHNIDGDKGHLSLNPDFNPPNPNQLMFDCLVVLRAIRSFLSYVVRKPHKRDMIELIDSYLDLLMQHNERMSREDWAVAK